MNSIKRFYTEPELYAMGFKKLGKNIKIARTATIENPEGVSIGNNSVISDYCLITGEEINIGNWTHIGHYSHLSGKGGSITFGDFVGIAGRCSFYTEADDFKREGLHYPALDIFRNPLTGPIKLDNLVLMGAGCLVLPNVEVQEGVTVYAKQILNKPVYQAWHIIDSSDKQKFNYTHLALQDKIRMLKKLTEPLHITAEIGSCWRGDMGTLSLMLEACKQAGVDDVKFQAFTEEHTSHPEKVINAVNADNVESIDYLCKTIGIPWYCTPCYEEAVTFLNPYVDKWKLRFKDASNFELFTAIDMTDKPIIVSDVHPWANATNVTSLYCIPKYPTPKEEVDIQMMSKFDGWSCHTPDVDFIVNTVKQSGIRHLEFHIKPDNGDDLVDGKIALDLFQMQELVSRLRENER